MADDASQQDQDSGFWSSLGKMVSDAYQATNPENMYANAYKLYEANGFSPEQAAEYAQRHQDSVSGKMLRTRAVANAVGYMTPATAPAMLLNDAYTAAESGDPRKIAETGAFFGAPRAIGQAIDAAAPYVKRAYEGTKSAFGYADGGDVDPVMLAKSALSAPRARRMSNSKNNAYADGGDVFKDMSSLQQAPEVDPVEMAKSVIAQPRPTITPGQRKLMATFQQENRPAAIVSPKPGTGSTENTPGWNFATPEGGDRPPPVQAPVRDIPRLSNISEHVQKNMKTKGFRDLVRDVAGLHKIDVTPTTGSWLGEVEPSFIINGYGPNGEEATPEQIRKLSHLLGFGHMQDAVVEQHHNPNIEEGIPTLYIGKGSKLSQTDLDAIHNASQENGLDFTRTKDGRGVKFSHFGDEADLPNFMQSVANVADKTGMPDRLHVRTMGDLKYAKGYLDEIFGGAGGEAGVPSGGPRSFDLFRRTVDHVLAPYAKAVASEGYRLSPDRLGEFYGLTPEEIEYTRDALLPKKAVDRSTVPLMTGEETLDVRPTGQRGENTVDDVLYALQNRAAARGQIDPTDRREETKNLIAKTMADEVGHHVNTSEKSAIGWYDSALKRAKNRYAEIFPEIKTDPSKEMLFDAILGITSQGNDVHANSVFASRLYNMVRDGEVPLSEAADKLKGTFGEQTRAIEYNLKKLDHLLTQNGFDRMKDVFNEKKTVGEWRKTLKDDKSLYGFDGKPLDIQGRSDQKVTGWMVFGPKIGSFINNLHGDYSTLTADLWFSRTYNRMLGHNFLHTPLQEAKQYRRFAEALSAEHAANNPVEGEPYDPQRTTDGKPDVKNGKPVMWEHGNDTSGMSQEELDEHFEDPEKMLQTAREVYDKYVKSGYKDKSDLRRRAKNWIENRYDPVAAPRGDEERGFQQEVAEKTQEMLRKKGIDISVADIQAALWFHEKELFQKHGVATSRSAPADYADAAERAVNLHKSGRLYDNWSSIQNEIKAEERAKRQAEKDRAKAEKLAQRGDAVRSRKQAKLSPLPMGEPEEGFDASPKFAEGGVVQKKNSLREPALWESAKRIKAGEGSHEEHADLVNRVKPVRPYAAPVAPATDQEVYDALDKSKKENAFVPRGLENGTPVAVRLDIPAYEQKNTWVVSVHHPKSDFTAGQVIGYDSVAHIDNPKFGVHPGGALNIASGKPKSTIATVHGNWRSITPEDAFDMAQQVHQDPEWRQVGMDPERHSYFYDRETQQPVISADEALHIGPLVYAKNPVYDNPENYKFADGGEVDRFIPRDDPRYQRNLKKFHGKTPDEIKNSRWYHGTQRDFQTFRPNADGLIFLTRNPKFADEYNFRGGMGQDFDEKNKVWLPREGSDLQPNTMPVHVRAENPFDYENPRHLNRLVQELGPDLIMDPYLHTFVDEVRQGHWGAIESSPIQSAIKAMGHDSFFVKENGEKNLGVYSPSQIKSAIGNNGDFDRNEEDINKERGGTVD